MKWLPFLILAYLMIGLQAGMGGNLRWMGAGPNLVLLAVVFIALNAPKEPALLGCLVLGLVHDLVTQQPLGLHALAYALGGMLIYNMQHVVHREHVLTQFSTTLLAGLVAAGLILLHEHLHPPGAAQVVDGSIAVEALRTGSGTVLLGALFTAALAPLVLWPLQRLRRVFSFDQARKRLAR
jgi:rod shape-determining protein MreD